MRMANNKHWLSDVLTGAGVGVLSTEMGYFLADLIFKDKGMQIKDNLYDKYLTNPSFIGLYMGGNIPLSGYDIDEHNEFSTSSGSSAGIEGAYFFNPYIGVGGRVTVSNTSIIVNNNQAQDNTLDVNSVAAGAYFSYPVSSRWLAGSKLLVEYVYYPKLVLSNKTIAARSGMGVGSGVSMTFKARNQYAMRFFLDYNLQPSHSKTSGEWMNTLSVGSAFIVML